MAVKFLIDSASDISEREAKELGVTMVPMQVRLDDEEFYDGVNLTPEEFFDKLKTCKEFPKTSLINEFRWEEQFEEVTKNGNEAVVITISSKLSGTYNSAVEASKKFEGKVFVVDSLNAALGERLLLQYGIRLANSGKSAKEIKEELDNVKNNIKLTAVLDTLKYLKKGGRISATTAFVGEMLQIKPAVAVVEGEVKMAGKVRGLKKGNQFLKEAVVSWGGINFDMPFGVLYSGKDDANLQSFIQEAHDLWQGKVENMPIYKLGSTIGTHVGPGAFGIAFFQK